MTRRSKIRFTLDTARRLLPTPSAASAHWDWQCLLAVNLSRLNAIPIPDRQPVLNGIRDHQANRLRRRQPAADSSTVYVALASNDALDDVQSCSDARRTPRYKFSGHPRLRQGTALHDADVQDSCAETMTAKADRPA